MSRNSIRLAQITAAGKNGEQFATQQLTYLGRVADSMMMFPYGLHANAPVGSLGLMFSVQGYPDDKVTIPWAPKTRPDLAEGEVAFYHPPTDGHIIWRESGKLEIITGTEGTADIEITASCVKINGNLEVTGSTALGATVTSNGVDISDTHKHSGVQTGAGNTGNPV